MQPRREDELPRLTAAVRRLRAHGTMDIDILNEPLGRDANGEGVLLRDIWPSEHEVAQTIEQAVQADMFHKSYSEGSPETSAGKRSTPPRRRTATATAAAVKPWPTAA